MSALWRWRTLALATLLAYLGTVVACPGSCVCKWKNGKQTVECNDKNLLSIPAGMDPGTQVLDMTDNKLDELHSEIFLKMDLINLQRIYLVRCRIHAIDEHAFRGLTNLVELDLAGNLLDVVPTDAFLDCISLMRLTLSSNPIKIIKKASFARLGFLNTLEISDCELEEVQEDAFHGLHSLEWLRLDGNQLKSVQGRRVLPENLRGVELQGNPWECDCRLVELRAWLKRYNGSQTTEPTCHGPSKHAKRTIKSIAADDLACLPDVSPTSLFLEISEGKNLTLMCNVHATPEARVTWWFEGQLLQNDTLISPGVRLLYFIEEDGEDKRSELFLYNANADDNGTFVCTAENPAGSVSANYTIRIIVKEEPIVIGEVFPFEYVLAGVIGAVALFMVVIVTIIVCVVKCRRNNKRMEKREKTKEVALQYQQNTNSKVTREDDTEQIPPSIKQNINEQEHQQDIMFYSPPLSKNILGTMSPVAMANQLHSPISLRRYQLEQNPDLINDTETGVRVRKDDVEGCRDASVCTEQLTPMLHPTLVQFQPISCMRGSRKLYSLHSWDAGCSMDSEGYPADYGLPKIQPQHQHQVPHSHQHHAAPPPQPQPAENFYRTLPYNRAAKRASAANPMSRYSREAEFLSRSAHPAPYEHYCPDVRYTADGYLPKHCDVGTIPQVTVIPSPPEGYKTDGAPSSLPCATTICWPARVKTAPITSADNKCSTISRRCVGAQTTETGNDRQHAANAKTEPPPGATSTPDASNEVNQSPDEGYVDEQAVTL
ncbi:leucine-rich repeat-containing protein 24 [Atheta coriaria]|uniref:leucine-rich repeat-containing protein 24 n=1 Tax=Dalotia coriaria TaxID=877792 RepID=UPI0031F37B57